MFLLNSVTKQKKRTALEVNASNILTRRQTHIEEIKEQSSPLQIHEVRTNLLHSSQKHKTSSLRVKKENSGSNASPADLSDHSITYLPNLPNITLRHTAFCKFPLSPFDTL